MNDIRPSYSIQQPHPETNDEISLVDLWLTLARHKTIILAAAIVCAADGLSFGVLSATKHTYVTAIQLGTPGLESTKTTVTKLEKLLFQRHKPHSLLLPVSRLTPRTIS